ncbi:MAG: peptidoglycan recognition family protein [Kofleriaceae bacterium]
MTRFVVLVLAACSSSAPPTPPPSPPAVAQADAAAVVVSADAAIAAAAPALDAAPSLAIVDAPIKWSAEREALTLDYRRQHSDASATDVTIAPKVIVLHYTGGGSAKGTRNYFDNVRIESSRAQLAKAGLVNVSSHYVVDRDGTIYRLQPETRFARHCIGLNHISIGIENVGNEKEFPLTDAQVTANAALVRDLAARFSITHLVGHYEVMGMKKSPLYVELDPKYANDKPDPGKAFMAKVRALVEDLALSGPD